MPRLDQHASGVYIISVTPFTDAGALDLAGTGRLVDFYLERGATGLTILGIMGEAPKLSASESLDFTREVLRCTAGRVPVVVGVSSPGFAAIGELSRAVMDAGAAGVMVAPQTAARTDDAIVGYFRMVVETLGDIPWVLQDYPMASGVQISVPVIRRVIETMPSCVMVKHEDWPGLAKLSALRAIADLRRVSVLVGTGGLFLPEELRRGADGAMTGFSYPEMMAGIYAAHVAGDDQRAADIFDVYLPLVRYEQQAGAGLAVRKHILHQRGAIGSSAQRRPVVGLSPADISDIEFLVARQTRRLQAQSLT
ncbi:MAG: dihydrodipicolinate synthase family protein [Acetobacteraceae bacterium]|nr:dihydrodipicolinate synthase family protein [Acetobacteraceae bacterium]